MGTTDNKVSFPLPFRGRAGGGGSRRGAPFAESPHPNPSPEAEGLMVRPFTGKHMAAILLAGFGIVVAVNFAMASLASSTFGGIVVENSYVASQHFNRWLDEAKAEESLGWKLAPSRREDGRIAARLEAVPGYPALAAVARHPLGRVPDMALTFERSASGDYVSRERLPEGRWTLRFAVEAQGKVQRSEQVIR